MLKIILPFVIVFSVSFTLMLTYNPSDDEKKIAWEQFVEEDFEFRDTVLTYTLDTSKLTIYFPKKPQFEQWMIEAWSNPWNEDSDSGVYFGSHTVKIRNGQVVIPVKPGAIKHPKEHKVTLFACPDMDGDLVISQPFGNIRAMFRETETNKGTLRPDDYWRGLKFVKIRMKALDAMDKESREYCMNKIETTYLAEPNNRKEHALPSLK